MRLIDIQNLVLDYSGLAKIAPNDYLEICRYFSNQIMGLPTIDLETLPIVQELREQLEQEKNKKIKIKYDDCIMTIGEICERLSNAEQQLEKVTAERDQAIEDLSGQCDYCQKQNDCIDRKGEHWNCWQWRGVQEEKNE